MVGKRIIQARRMRRLDLALTLAGIAGLIVIVALYDRAFPSAALDLELSRQQIADEANAYLAYRGYNVTGYESALTFSQAYMASVYLQRTLGIPQTNALARQEDLPLWYWDARWFRPLQQQEFRLSLMPNGEVIALRRVVPEDAPGAALPQAEARTLAEEYLTGDRGWDLANWEMVTASSVTRLGRQDHHFEWKRSNWDTGDSELRLAVDIQGDQVGGYGYWIQVPEAFVRSYAEQRSMADFLDNIAFYLGAGSFGLAALIFFYISHRRGITPWHEGLKPGLAVAGVYALYTLNWLPLAKADYGTTQSYGVFWVNQVIGTLITAGAIAGVVMILWTGGRALARKVWPQQDRLLPRGDDRWSTFGRSTWRGIMVGCLDGGVVVLFYLAVTRLFGAWLPMDLPDVNLFATPVPFAAPLAVGVIPAVVEEFLFRLIGIGLVLALLRKHWLALLIPGVLWAFAHTSYISDPIYLRGIEVTITALIYGYIFTRFDLATTIVAHLTYNAGLYVMPLLRSGQPYFVANGLLVVAILVTPVAVGLARAWRRRRFGILALPEPNIRPATRQDLDSLTALGPQDTDWGELLVDPAATVMGLWAGERLIGAAAAHGQEVKSLFVEPGWRRRYLGSRLVQALANALPEGTSLKALALADDWRLSRFWDSLGWKAATTTYARPTGELSGVRERRVLQVIKQRINMGGTT
ncbi:MAG: GNAT family N-acetyltransferase [Anaerolineae bacterium]|nr:GNAT family N-acetyltransferase [Anaerolineae bacterium]